MVTKTSDDLSGRFEELKYRFKLTNSELAAMAGVTPQAISDICTGTTLNPRISLITNIANKLDVSVDWLVSGRGEMKVETRVTGHSNDSSLVDFLVAQITEKDKVINRLLDRLGKRKGVSNQASLFPVA